MLSLPNTYFDNAATSFPKPREVAAAMARYLNDEGGPYGRSFYKRALKVSRHMEECREDMARLIGCSDSRKMIFATNATVAANMVIKGLKLAGKDVWVSPMEHNAIIRPLKKTGANIKILPSHCDGRIHLDQISKLDFSNAALAIVAHQSNVNGLVQNIPSIREAIKCPFLVDGAQSLPSHLPNVEKNNIDYFIFTGHKGLLGPTGTGGFYVKNPEVLDTILEGGTGSHSESEDMPDFFPDKFSPGTPNIVGIYGLKAAITSRPISLHSKNDFHQLCEKVKTLSQFQYIGAFDLQNQGELFSLVHKNKDCSTIALELFERFDIETRPGLHCAPMAHKHLKTFPTGTLRVSFSPYHQKEDFDFLLSALTELA